jgi:hypothetical protein
LGTQRNEESTTEIKEQIVAETNIKITADTRSAERAINNLESALQDLDKVSGVVGGALAALTAAGAGVAIAFKSVADSVGELADIGKALGMTAQQLGYLRQSAQLAGVGADELNGALFRLQGNIGDALLKGTGPATDALERLGLSVRELSTLPADQQIAKITEQLREIPNPAERSALAIDLLGKQGPRLLEVADNAARIAEEAKKMGIALSDLDVRNFEKAGDAIDELTFIAQGVLKSALAELSPYIIAIAQSLSEAAKEGGGLGNIIRERVIPTIRIATQAMAILAAYFVAARLTAGVIAATTAMIKMYQAIKVATTAAAMLNAVLGKNPLLKIAGAVAGLVGAAVVVDKIGDQFDELDKKAAAINANTQTELKKEAELRKQVGVEAEKPNQEQQKALKALEQTIVKLEQSAKFEQEKLSLGEAQANINKLIREEEEKLALVKASMSSKDKQRITDAYLALEATKQQASMTKTLEGLETERLGLTIEDKNQRQITLAIRAKELEFGRTLTAQEREQLTTAIQKNQLADQTRQINTALKSLDNERLLLAISDKDQREEQRQIMTLQEQLGRNLTATERERLSNSIKLTQQAREQAAIAEAITNYTREQTELEKINRGINLQKTLGGGMLGGVTSEKEYQRDQDALQAMLDNKLISEQQYYAQREELARAYNLKIQELELKRIETVLMKERSGMAATMSDKDRAILQQVGANERQKAIVDERIKFEKQSELQKTQFVLEQGATIFNALGAQNKKAFEAAKAFNIANAIMNTYMAATKALATYPFPFGLIAAAGAVAAGLAQVAQIRSQNYSGRALGGPVMGGKSYIVGESGPELFTPSTTGSITRNGDLQGGGVTNVNFTIVANDTTGFDQLLASRKGVIQQIISDAMLEKGRRSMV